VLLRYRALPEPFTPHITPQPKPHHARPAQPCTQTTAVFVGVASRYSSVFAASLRAALAWYRQEYDL